MRHKIPFICIVQLLYELMMINLRKNMIEQELYDLNGLTVCYENLFFCVTSNNLIDIYCALKQNY